MYQSTDMLNPLLNPLLQESVLSIEMSSKSFKPYNYKIRAKKPEAEIVLYFQHSILGMSAKQAKNLLGY